MATCQLNCPPGLPETALCDSDHQDLNPLCIIIHLLELHLRDVADRLEEPQLLNQSAHSRPAYSTASSDFHGPCARMTSALNSWITESACVVDTLPAPGLFILEPGNVCSPVCPATFHSFRQCFGVGLDDHRCCHVRDTATALRKVEESQKDSLLDAADFDGCYSLRHCGHRCLAWTFPGLVQAGTVWLRNCPSAGHDSDQFARSQQAAVANGRPLTLPQ